MREGCQIHERVNDDMESLHEDQRTKLDVRVQHMKENFGEQCEKMSSH